MQKELVVASIMRQIEACWDSVQSPTYVVPRLTRSKKESSSSRSYGLDPDTLVTTREKLYRMRILANESKPSVENVVEASLNR